MPRFPWPLSIPAPSFIWTPSRCRADAGPSPSGRVPSQPLVAPDGAGAPPGFARSAPFLIPASPPAGAMSQATRDSRPPSIRGGTPRCQASPPLAQAWTARRPPGQGVPPASPPACGFWMSVAGVIRRAAASPHFMSGGSFQPLPAAAPDGPLARRPAGPVPAAPLYPAAVTVPAGRPPGCAWPLYLVSWGARWYAARRYWPPRAHCILCSSVRDKVMTLLHKIQRARWARRQSRRLARWFRWFRGLRVVRWLFIGAVFVLLVPLAFVGLLSWFSQGFGAFSGSAPVRRPRRSRRG